MRALASAAGAGFAADIFPQFNMSMCPRVCLPGKMLHPLCLEGKSREAGRWPLWNRQVLFLVPTWSPRGLAGALALLFLPLLPELFLQLAAPFNVYPMDLVPDVLSGVLENL